MTYRPLRILVPNFPAPDSFTDNVVHTLRAMGHEVRCMDRLGSRDRGRIGRILHDAWMGYRPQTLTEQETWVLAQAQDWKPDLMIALTLSLRDAVLAELRATGVTGLVAWWGDTPANMRGMGLLADGWDRIYIKDAAAVAKFCAVGLPADLMHEAMNPDWHQPLETSSHPDTGSVVVAGSYYGYRQIMIDRLEACNIPLALYGPRPPRWSRPSVQAGHRGKYIVKDEKSRAFHAGLACLNSTALSEGNSLNCRAFEICGTGGLQLIEDKSAVADCFDPGHEVLTYRSVDEICAYLDRARKDPDWARSIREAGLARARAHHTYRHRLNRILSDLDMAPAQGSPTT